MKIKLLISIAVFLLTVFIVLANTNAFYNNFASTNLSFTGNENKTTYIDIPQNVYITLASMGITGYNNNLSSTITFIYNASYFNMTDGCSGSIDLAPDATHELEICLQQSDGTVITSSCNTLTSGNYGTSQNMMLSPIQKSLLTNGNNYSIKLHWKRIKYIYMNNSALNGYNDSGQTRNYYSKCISTNNFVWKTDASCSINVGELSPGYPYFYDVWSNGFTCTGTQYISSNLYPSFSDIRIFEAEPFSGANATLGSSSCVYFNVGTVKGNYGNTSNCFNTGVKNKYATVRTCTSGIDPTPSGPLCTYAGDTTTYSSNFTYNSNYTNFNLSFNNYLNSSGNLIFYSSPSNLYLEIGTPNNNPEWKYTNNLVLNININLNISVLQSTINTCSCSDCSIVDNKCRVPFLFHSDTSGILQLSNLSITYNKSLCLIDEKNNTLFDVNNLTSVKIYNDYNSTLVNLKTLGTSCTNLSTQYNKVRVELCEPTYCVNRFIDLDLVQSNIVRVCANRQGTDIFPQIIYSATQRPALLKSLYSNCYVAADYTRFTYQNGYSLQVATINTPYNLYVTDTNGNQILLGGFDGSVAVNMQIDAIQFNQKGYNLDYSSDAISFQKQSGNTIMITYMNLLNDNNAIDVKITRMDTGDIVGTYVNSDFLSKNNFTLYFDYTTLSPAVNDSTLFKLELTKTTSKSTNVLTRYFTSAAKSGTLAVGVAMTIAILLLVFGLTFTSIRITFSWFGIACCLACIAILSFTIAYWYVLFTMFMAIIILVYIVLYTIKVNPQSLA